MTYLEFEKPLADLEGKTILSSGQGTTAQAVTSTFCVAYTTNSPISPCTSATYPLYGFRFA